MNERTAIIAILAAAVVATTVVRAVVHNKDNRMRVKLIEDEQKTKLAEAKLKTIKIDDPK